MNRYLIIIEKTETGYSAFSPDIAGCVATGDSRDNVEIEMKSAIAFHLEGLRELGESIPTPSSEAAYCDLTV